MAASLPGNYATPGAAWPGMIWPGQPLTGFVAGYLFQGPVALIYPDYLDETAQHTLVAAPGQVYKITPPAYPAETSLVPNDGRWTAV